MTLFINIIESNIKTNLNSPSQKRSCIRVWKILEYDFTPLWETKIEFLKNNFFTPAYALNFIILQILILKNLIYHFISLKEDRELSLKKKRIPLLVTIFLIKGSKFSLTSLKSKYHNEINSVVSVAYLEFFTCGSHTTPLFHRFFFSKTIFARIIHIVSKYE